MGGYSKMKDINTTNNDPKSSPSKSSTDSSPDPNKSSPEPIQQQDPMNKEEDEGENTKDKLKRNLSTSSSRFMRLDRQNSNSIVSSKALQGALRRAFSVRSSSSEKYSRIYSDRPVALDEEDRDDDDDEDGDENTRSDKKDVKETKKKKSSKIIRACKRILGL